MPRDSNGLYTLPTGNPVIDGSIIEAIWANTTISDIAQQLNNVLTRDGLLGPTESMLLVNGSSLVPALAFNTQPNLGLYRDSVNSISIVAHGVPIFKFSDTNSDSLLALGLINGSTLFPALRFTSDADTGFFLDSDGKIGVSTGGVAATGFSNLGIVTKSLVVQGVIDALDTISAGNVLYVNQIDPVYWSGLISKKASKITWMLRFADNVGNSDFALIRADDIGNLIDYPMLCRRSDGMITIKSLFVNGDGLSANNAIITNSFEFASGVRTKSVINKRGGAAVGTTIDLGWNGNLTLGIDATDFGKTWPIDISGLAAKASTISSGGGAGPGITFNYAGQAGTPAYVWGTNDGVNSYVWGPSTMTVGTASNALAMAGVPSTGWARGDSAWIVGLGSNSIHTPYIGQAPAGTGAVVWLVHAAGGCHELDYSATYIRFYDNVGYMIGSIGLIMNSDLRLKKDVKPSKRKALDDIKAMEFIQFRYNDKSNWEDKKTLYNVGFSGQNLQSINTQYVNEVGDDKYLAPDQRILFPLACKAIQELEARVAALETT
jgi:hypothetical protein